MLTVPVSATWLGEQRVLEGNMGFWLGAQGGVWAEGHAWGCGRKWQLKPQNRETQ